jgi:hypothetical protein
MTPITRLAIKGLYFFCNLGNAKPLQPNSSPTGPFQGIRTTRTKYRGINFNSSLIMMNGGASPPDSK